MGGPLEVIEETVDFEYFGSWLLEELGYGSGAKVGRMTFDPMSIFKVLLLLGQHNLSVAPMAFMLRDWLSWLCFAGGDLGESGGRMRTPPGCSATYRGPCACLRHRLR